MNTMTIIITLAALVAFLGGALCAILLRKESRQAEPQDKPAPTRKKAIGHPYTPEEDELILDAKTAEQKKKLAKRFGRTFDAIKQRRYVLQKEQPKVRRKKRALSNQPRAHAPWTEMEDTFVMDNRGRMTDRQIGKVLGRSRKAVCQRRQKMGRELGGNDLPFGWDPRAQAQKVFAQ